MSTVSYTNSIFAPAQSQTAKAPRKSIWRRFVAALMESQQRRAEHEIARYLAGQGGLLTDETEREIMRRITGNDRKLV
jgi:hypothetical protein